MSSTSTSTNSRPIVEVREYELIPSEVKDYIIFTEDSSELRKYLAPLRIFAFPETGGQINVATHFYHFKDGFSERDERRAEMSKNEEWKKYLTKVKPLMQKQRTNIYEEADFVRSAEFDGKICGLKSEKGDFFSKDETCFNSKSVFEIYRYNLKCDEDNLTQFLVKYKGGLQSKLEALGEDSSTSLVTLLHSTVGHNQEVIEIWRHGEGIAAVETAHSRVSGPKEWSETIANLMKLSNSVTNTIYKPVTFSPLR